MRITFAGAPGVGKTTLTYSTKAIDRFSAYPIMKNYRRQIKDIIDISITGEASTYELQYAFMLFHLANYNENSCIIADRSIADILAYTKASNSISPKQKRKFYSLFSKYLEQEDVVFYIPIEFPAKNDGTRSTDEKYREEIDRHIKTFLIKNKIKYITVKGTPEERSNIVSKALETAMENRYGRDDKAV